MWNCNWYLITNSNTATWPHLNHWRADRANSVMCLRLQNYVTYCVLKQPVLLLSSVRLWEWVCVYLPVIVLMCSWSSVHGELSLSIWINYLSCLMRHSSRTSCKNTFPDIWLWLCRFNQNTVCCTIVCNHVPGANHMAYRTKNARATAPCHQIIIQHRVFLKPCTIGVKCQVKCL